MKFLRASLLVFTLIFTSVVNVPGSLAEASNTSNQSNTSTSSTQTSGGETTAAGTFVGEGTDETSFMNMLTMIAIGGIARGLLACELKTMDTIAAAVGGGIYIFGELMTLMGSSEMKKQEYQYSVTKDGTITDSDRNALEGMKQNYEKAKKNLERKKQMQMIATMAWVAATGIAAYMAYTLDAEAAACEGVPIDCFGDPTTALAKTIACQRACNLVHAKEKALEGPSSFISAEILTAAQTALGGACTACTKCPAYLTALSASLNKCSEGIHAQLVGQSPLIEKDIKKYFALRGMGGFYDDTMNHLMERESFGVRQVDSHINIFSALFIPQANAILGSITKFLGLGAVGIGVWMGLKAEKATFIDRWMATYTKRAFVFAGMAALGYFAMNETQGQIDKIQSNIDKINQILKGLKSTAPLYTGGSTPSTLTTDPITYDQISIPDGVKIPCALPNCAPVADEIDEAFESDPHLQNFQNLPAGSKMTSAIAGAADLAGKLGKGSKLSKGTLGQISSLSAKNAAVKKAFDELTRDLNGKLEAAGGKPLNLMEGNPVVGGLKSAGMDMAKSGMGRGGFGAPSTNKSSKVVAAITKEKSKGNKAYYTGKGKGSYKRKRRKKRSYGNPYESNANIKNVGQQQIDEEYEEHGGNDIAPADGLSIWKLISTRYLKSGADRVLELKED